MGRGSSSPGRGEGGRDRARNAAMLRDSAARPGAHALAKQGRVRRQRHAGFKAAGGDRAGPRRARIRRATAKGRGGAERDPRRGAGAPRSSAEEASCGRGEGSPRAVGRAAARLRAAPSRAPSTAASMGKWGSAQPRPERWLGQPPDPFLQAVMRKTRMLSRAAPVWAPSPGGRASYFPSDDILHLWVLSQTTSGRVVSQATFGSAHQEGAEQRGSSLPPGMGCRLEKYPARGCQLSPGKVSSSGYRACVDLSSSHVRLYTPQTSAFLAAAAAVFGLLGGSRDHGEGQPASARLRGTRRTCHHRKGKVQACELVKKWMNKDS
eukprot:gene16283-biopygen8855